VDLGVVHRLELLFTVARKIREASGDALRLMTAACIAHQWLVRLHHVQCMLIVPAGLAEVAKAHEFAAKIWALSRQAIRAGRVFQIWIDLNLLRKFGTFDFHESGGNGLVKTAAVVERHSTRTDWILVLVGIDSRVHDAAEQIVQYIAQYFGRDHAVQSANENRFLRVQALRRETQEVAVADIPWNDLHLSDLFGTHTARRQLIVVFTGVREVAGAAFQ